MTTSAGNRWEWRAFADNFGEPDGSLRQNVAPRNSRETYLLHDGSVENVKVRGGVLDVKSFVDVNADGLQLWTPFLKAPFPVPAAVVHLVFERWGTVPPELHRAQYTEDEWMSEIVARTRALRAVIVNKIRYGSVRDGCLVESADLLIDDRPIRTIGVESEDPAAVVRVVSSLGLSHSRNEDYQAALKRLTGFPYSNTTAPWRAHV